MSFPSKTIQNRKLYRKRNAEFLCLAIQNEWTAANVTRIPLQKDELNQRT